MRRSIVGVVIRSSIDPVGDALAFTHIYLRRYHTCSEKAIIVLSNHFLTHGQRLPTIAFININ